MDALLASTVPALFGWGWTARWDWWWAALPMCFAMVPFLLRRENRFDWLLLGCFVALAVAHLGTRAHGLHGFGPRYYFDVFFALYLLTARGFQELGRIGAEPDRERAGGRPRLAAAFASASLFAALNIPALASLPQRLALYRGYNHVDGSLRTQIEQLDVDRALILFAERDWRNWAVASTMMSADATDDLAFATSRDDDSALLEYYDDRPVYLWSDGELKELQEQQAIGR
jgi:hypothetical protein